MTGPAAGVRDGRELAVDLAAHRGLGLVGTGAAAAARALLLTLLARRHDPAAPPVNVLIPADTAEAVLGRSVTAAARPSRLQVTTSLDTALDAAEVELLTRTRLPDTERQQRLGTLVLIATPEPHAQRRLQAVLDNGSTLGITAVLIGQWRPGATARVRADGTVAAASPNLADTLTGARLFTPAHRGHHRPTPPAHRRRGTRRRRAAPPPPRRRPAGGGDGYARRRRAACRPTGPAARPAPARPGGTASGGRPDNPDRPALADEAPPRTPTHTASRARRGPTRPRPHRTGNTTYQPRNAATPPPAWTLPASRWP